MVVVRNGMEGENIEDAVFLDGKHRIVSEKDVSQLEEKGHGTDDAITQ